MSDQHPLSDIAELYQANKTLFQNATAKLSQERKNYTLSEKIYDFIANTSSEEELAKYNEQFTRTEKEARFRVDRWVDNNVVHELKASGEFNHWIELGNERFKTQQFADKVGSAIRLGQHALNTLDAAENACKHARNMELADAVSSSKGIAAASALANVRARDWLKESEKAIHAYLGEFADNNVKNEKMTSGNLDVDLVVDMLFPGSPDFLSFANMISFDSKAKHCKNAADQLMRSMQPLYATRDILKEAEKSVAVKMDAISNNTRDKLQQTIPKELTDVINPNNSISFSTHMDPQKHDEITDLVSKVSLSDFIKSQVEPATEKNKKHESPALNM